MEGQEMHEFVKRIAVMEVCPNTQHPSTVYEINMVKSLTAFGYRVLKEWQESALSCKDQEM